MISKIEKFLIEEVKKRRLEMGMSQLELSQAIGYSDSFIAHVEAPSKRAKYNVNHLNQIAKALNCSPKDFWPDNPI